MLAGRPRIYNAAIIQWDHRGCAAWFPAIVKRKPISYLSREKKKSVSRFDEWRAPDGIVYLYMVMRCLREFVWIMSIFCCCFIWTYTQSRKSEWWSNRPLCSFFRCMCTVPVKREHLLQTGGEAGHLNRAKFPRKLKWPRFGGQHRHFPYFRALYLFVVYSR